MSKRRDGAGQFVRVAAIERFLAQVIANDQGGCWVWAGDRGSNGYGRFWDGSRNALAHRWAYELLVGPIGPGLTLDHLCRNRPCVNPVHLEPGTTRENLLRGIGVAAVNTAKTACPKGHPFNATNTYVDRTGRRHCRQCSRTHQLAWLARKAATTLEVSRV